MTDRTSQLRHALVATVDAALYERRRPRTWMFVAGASVVAIASSLTGYAAATATTGVTPEQATERWVLSFARANSQLLGEVFHTDSDGPVTIDLGEAPEGATGVVLVSSCTSVGTLDVIFDGTSSGGADCTADGPQVGGGTAWTEPVTTGGPHTLTVDTDPGMTHEVWAAWVKEPPLPEQSAQQRAELSDGVVTRPEYAAAFNRYLGCLAALGHDAGGFEQREDYDRFLFGPPSAAVDDGSDEICYTREFKDVDMLWQLSLEER